MLDRSRRAFVSRVVDGRKFPSETVLISKRGQFTSTRSRASSSVGNICKPLCGWVFGISKIIEFRRVRRISGPARSSRIFDPARQESVTTHPWGWTEQRTPGAGQNSAPRHGPQQPPPPQPIALLRSLRRFVRCSSTGRRSCSSLRSCASCDFRAFVRFAHENLARAFLARAPAPPESTIERCNLNTFHRTHHRFT